MCVTAEVPFIDVDGRRALTWQAVVDHPELESFVRRFASCFEVDPYTDLLLFLEADQSRTWPAPTFVK